MEESATVVGAAKDHNANPQTSFVKPLIVHRHFPFDLCLEPLPAANAPYRSEEVRQWQDTAPIFTSFSRSVVNDHCRILLGSASRRKKLARLYDNAVMERFFWSLKHEWTKHPKFDNLEDARLSVFKYIETFYNPLWIHQTLGYLSPNEYEAVNAPAVAA